ncbi:MAG: ankyrin repeat domain-containing protein [Curvibacter sp.]|nr:MAG: ankyrin repeat domain-containing protein [Curvibacter sp.]
MTMDRRRAAFAALLLLSTAVVQAQLVQLMGNSPALVEAAARGQWGKVLVLLDGGEPIESRADTARSRNATPVLAATQGNHVEVVRLLVSRGANVNAQDAQQDSAFLLASASGFTDIVQITLAAGADVTSTNRYGGTALIPACHYGHVDTVRLLLTTGIAVDHVNNLGWTALLEAVILGSGGLAHAEIVRMLIAAKANVNLADAQGVTPLQHALARKHVHVAELLRDAGGR